MEEEEEGADATPRHPPREERGVRPPRPRRPRPRPATPPPRLGAISRRRRKNGRRADAEPKETTTCIYSTGQGQARKIRRSPGSAIINSRTNTLGVTNSKTRCLFTASTIQ